MAQARHPRARRGLIVTVLFALSLLGAGCPPPSGEGEGEGEGAPETVTVSLAPSADTTLFESSTGGLANGAGEYLFTARTGQGYRRRTLLKFDVAAAIPAGAQITEAHLRLHMSRTIAGPVAHYLYVPPADWGEGDADSPDMEGTGTTPQPGDATWLHTFYPDAFWPQPGAGEFAPAEAHATRSVDANGFYDFSSTVLAGDVQAWLDGSADNFGWILLGDETVIKNAKRWDSRENADASVRPVLLVTYTP